MRRLWGAVAVLLLAAAAANAQYWWPEVISVSITGEQADGRSGDPTVSADGRFVAFDSYATNLVPGDTNQTTDVFVRDRLLATTERISVSTTGQQGNDWSAYAAMSPDARFVAFVSWADNLAPGDSNGLADVFVRDRLAGTTELISVSTADEQANDNCYAPSISSDGRFVAFVSRADNLVSDDTNAIPGDDWSGYDVFVRDRTLGTTERVSVSSAGEQADGASGSDSLYGYATALSADGRFVAFSSRASNLVAGDTNNSTDAFVHDLQTGETTRTSVNSDGSQMDAGGMYPRLSSDGRFVAFSAGGHIYVRDRVSGETVHIGSGVFADFLRDSLAISGDGTTVAFNYTYCCDYKCLRYCAAVNFYDIPRRRIVGGYGSGEDLALSGDGRFLGYSGIYVPQVYVYDRFTDLTPPETEVVQDPCGQTITSPSATFSWTGSDPPVEGKVGPVAYSWRLDGENWIPWTLDTSVTLTGIADGARVFEVKARDLNGNQEDQTPARCEFTVAAGGPDVTITSPAPGATVRRTATIAATASSPAGISHIDLYVDGGLICSDFTAPYSCEWRWMSSAPQGSARICAQAFDSLGASTRTCADVSLRNWTFDDVPLGSPLWAPVEALVDRGITNGCSANPPLFCPSAKVTRAQMAVLICRAAGKQPLDSPTPTFADVPKTNPYYGWVERLADGASWNGAAPTHGCAAVPDREFCPNSAVTRQQMAVFLCRATGKSPMPNCSGAFADVQPGSAFCPWIERLADAASWPNDTAVTNGCGCAETMPAGSLCYCPGAAVTREQMAVMLVRAFGIPL